MLLAQLLAVFARVSYASEQPAGVAELLMVAQRAGELDEMGGLPVVVERPPGDGDQHRHDRVDAPARAQLVGESLDGSRRRPRRRR